MRSIIGGDVNSPYADWNGNASSKSATQEFINSLVWENGFNLIVDSPTRVDALLDIYLSRNESSISYNSRVQGDSDQAVILEVKWENCCEPQVESLVPVYNKIGALGLQTFLRDKVAGWAINDSSFERMWNNFMNIVCETRMFYST
jgi:hypothetical protein